MMDAFLRLRVEPTESLSRLVCLLAEQVGEEELQKTFSTLEEAGSVERFVCMCEYDSATLVSCCSCNLNQLETNILF